MTVDLPIPTVGSGTAGEPLLLDLAWEGRHYSVRLLDVGLACCSVEVMAAALGSRSTRARGSLGHTRGPVDVLVVSGTCTDVLAPAVRRLHASLAGSPIVVSFGACSSSGGPYWDSYAVTQGIDQIIPVDVYVPGCPPPPQALLEAVARAEQSRAAASAEPGGDL
jgi:NADH-quinone oxidoreductase subunit B